jgi:hypothetical protein
MIPLSVPRDSEAKRSAVIGEHSRIDALSRQSDFGQRQGGAGDAAGPEDMRRDAGSGRVRRVNRYEEVGR